MVKISHLYMVCTLGPPTWAIGSKSNKIFVEHPTKLNLQIHEGWEVYFGFLENLANSKKRKRQVSNRGMCWDELVTLPFNSPMFYHSATLQEAHETNSNKFSPLYFD